MYCETDKLEHIPLSSSSSSSSPLSSLLSPSLLSPLSSFTSRFRLSFYLLPSSSHRSLTNSHQLKYNIIPFSSTISSHLPCYNHTRHLISSLSRARDQLPRLSSSLVPRHLVRIYRANASSNPPSHASLIHRPQGSRWLCLRRLPHVLRASSSSLGI
jgi:hypothetical protein